jgi:hypothetical protein
MYGLILVPSPFLVVLAVTPSPFRQLALFHVVLALSY